MAVALVRGVHGLRGRLRVEVLTDHPEARFAAGAALWPEGSDHPLTVAAATPVADGPGWWLDVAGIDDRAAAEALRGAYLEALVPASDLPDGEVWWHEVIGVDVVATDGRELGRVVDVYRAGGAEVLVVDGPGGIIDIPNVAAIVLTFAPREGRIVVDLAALDLDAEPRAKRPRGRRTRRAAEARAASGSGPAGEAPG